MRFPCAPAAIRLQPISCQSTSPISTCLAPRLYSSTIGSTSAVWSARAALAIRAPGARALTMVVAPTMQLTTQAVRQPVRCSTAQPSHPAVQPSRRSLLALAPLAAVLAVPLEASAGRSKQLVKSRGPSIPFVRAAALCGMCTCGVQRVHMWGAAWRRGAACKVPEARAWRPRSKAAPNPTRPFCSLGWRVGSAGLLPAGRRWHRVPAGNNHVSCGPEEPWSSGIATGVWAPPAAACCCRRVSPCLRPGNFTVWRGVPRAVHAAPARWLGGTHGIHEKIASNANRPFISWTAGRTRCSPTRPPLTTPPRPRGQVCCSFLGV